MLQVFTRSSQDEAARVTTRAGAPALAGYRLAAGPEASDLTSPELGFSHLTSKC